MSRFLKDIKKYWRYVFYAGQSSLKAEVASSYLHWLWWIIEPLSFMLIYTFIFAILFQSNIEHAPIFIYIGIINWDFFNRVLKLSVRCVKQNKAIVSKVYVPKFVLLLVELYVNAFKAGIGYLLLFVLMLCMGIPFSWYMLWLIPISFVTMLVAFGVSTFLLHFGVYVDDMSNLINIALRMLFYITGVFYDLRDKLSTIVGKAWAVRISNMNPIACLIQCARDCILNGQTPNLKYLFLWFLLGNLLSILGIALIYRNENNYVKVI